MRYLVVGVAFDSEGTSSSSLCQLVQTHCKEKRMIVRSIQQKKFNRHMKKLVTVDLKENYCQQNKSEVSLKINGLGILKVNHTS